MSEPKQWSLNDPNLPEELHLIREVFTEKSSRKEEESLHDYYTRMGYRCFCKDCRQQSKLL